MLLGVVLVDPAPRLGLALGLAVLILLLLLLLLLLVAEVVVAGWEVNCSNDDLTSDDAGCGLLP